MNEFIAERIRVESQFGQLMSMEEKERVAAIEQVKKDAEARSAFKKFQLVRACRPKSLSLVTWTMDTDPSDPKSWFDTRVTGWDVFGRLTVAHHFGSNPHNSDGPWGDDHIEPRDDEDWLKHSEFKVGQEVCFVWELYGFSGKDNWPMGREVPATIEAPHIRFDDWTIRYPRFDNGYRITRVVNGRQMRPA